MLVLFSHFGYNEINIHTYNILRSVVIFDTIRTYFMTKILENTPNSLTVDYCRYIKVY